MKKTRNIIILIIILVILITTCLLLFNNNSKEEIITVKSEKELLKIYEGRYGEEHPILKTIFRISSLPFYILTDTLYYPTYNYKTKGKTLDSSLSEDKKGIVPRNITGTASTDNALENKESIKDYSTTNIQVENVDEADIIKTDGNYIYSISEDKVIITNVTNPEDIKIEEKISPKGVPEDLIIYNDKLVVISAGDNSRYSNTNVEIFDITDKTNAKLVKKYQLYEPYYTSRCINNQLYVISSGEMKKDGNKISRKYSEDGIEKEIPLNKIKYLRELKTYTQTLISSVDLNNVTQEIKLDTYLMDISNAYVSENNIYLLDEKYNDEGSNKDLTQKIKSLFGLKGIFGLSDIYDETTYDYSLFTQIYKFEISKNGNVEYKKKTKTEGKTINQYSLDEEKGHLRIALSNSQKGSRIVIFDEDLKQIGATPYLAEGENMYSSRFMGNKAYLVTYKTVDPLFVIDLSNEEAPQVLGELKIPGYSTYLHPYDENHLIGIGMQTEETVNRNANGKVISTTARITGMKMALFDVTDVNKPVQMSEAVIGDSRTTSAILTNPKALLFSKEKELIAIPVNNYDSDFSITSTGVETYTSVIDSYKNKSKNYVSEGYIVYKINLEEGLKLKGNITHKNTKFSYTSNSKLLRGLYIKDNLYTISQTNIKVNNLDSLELIKEIEIK